MFKRAFNNFIEKEAGNVHIVIIIILNIERFSQDINMFWLKNIL